MTEIWHGREVRGKLPGCSDDCGSRYDPPKLSPVHSRGCPNRPADNTGTVEEMYWWNNEGVVKP